MSKEYQLTMHNLSEVFNGLQSQLINDPHLIVNVQAPGVGKWGMSRLWRQWMNTTAIFMASNGCTMPHYQTKDGDMVGTRPFNENDAHELFTSRWMGLDNQGNRLSWAKKDSDGKKAALKGERFQAMRKHDEWAIEKGIVLMQPRGSEYEQLQNQ